MPGFAAEGETTYTITINNATDGHTYEAYQVFAGDLADGVLSNITWGKGVNGEALLGALQGDTTIGSYFGECSTAADVAKVLSDNATAMEGTPAFASNSANLDVFAAIVGKHLGSATGTSTDADDTYTISGLEAGYYFVKDKDDSLTGENPDAYTKFMLELVENTTVSPKSDVPSVEKKVKEDDKYNQDDGYGTGYNDVADWTIGEAVPFKLIGTIPAMDGYETYKYIFHDTISAGLTLDTESVKVYVTEDKNADLSSLTPLTAGSDYELITSPTESHCSFEIAFSDLKSVEIPEGSKYIIVAYTATLNENAEIGRPGNPNNVYLEFSNNPAQSGEGDNETDETPKDYVIVFTYELDGTKVDAATMKPPKSADSTPRATALEGAQFVLLNSTGDKVAKLDENGKFDGWIDLPEGTGTDGAITFDDWTAYDETNKVILTSDEEGLFKIIGLDDGTYKLREIKAPDGYNLLTSDVEVTIKATTANGQEWTGAPEDALTKLVTTSDGGDPETGVAFITIGNNKGATLPETGGMGTTLFYIVGTVLVIGAAVLLVTRRRVNAQDK